MSFISAMFGPAKSGQHVFVGEGGFQGANGNICCVPDGLGGDSTHLCGKAKGDLIHKTPDPVRDAARAALVAVRAERDSLHAAAERDNDIALGLMEERDTVRAENLRLREALADVAPLVEHREDRTPLEVCYSWCPRCRIDAALAATAKPVTQHTDALRYATDICKAMAAAYPAVPEWKPLDDLMEVLSQIDNMWCGFRERLAATAKPDAPVPEQAQPEPVRALPITGTACDTSGEPLDLGRALTTSRSMGQLKVRATTRKQLPAQTSTTYLSPEIGDPVCDAVHRAYHIVQEVSETDSSCSCEVAMEDIRREWPQYFKEG